jgi:hypothetical protein
MLNWFISFGAVTNTIVPLNLKSANTHPKKKVFRVKKWTKSVNVPSTNYIVTYITYNKN